MIKRSYKPKEFSKLVGCTVGTLQRWDREGFLQPIETLTIDVFVTYKDRFVRFGFEWFEEYCKKYGTEIVVLNQKSTARRISRRFIEYCNSIQCKTSWIKDI